MPKHTQPADTDMVVFRNVRYSRADARQLGIPLDGKVVTKQSERVEHGEQDPAPLSTASAEDAAVSGDLPDAGASKAVWTKYALANGQTPESLQGLTKDDIVALFESSEA